MKAMGSRKSSRAGPGGPGSLQRGDPLTGAHLARMWLGAGVFSSGFAGCLCAGGFHAPVDAGAIAEDLLIYLADKYSREGRAALAAFVARARGRAGGFSDWLGELDVAELAPQDRGLLLEDLRTTLDSMSGSGGFACT
ncbi:MAG: hypothetical protein JWN93_2275 [Hyphomicrobiales bacterium]|nr:hypothetical protein [Hyphomicrobiales bacterium]